MRPVADDPVGGAAGEIDAHAEPVVEGHPRQRHRPVVVVVEQRPALVDLPQRRVGDRPVPDQQPQLVERGARVHAHRKGLRRDLQVEVPAVAGRDLVEAGRAIGDDPREDVEPARRALGIRASAHPGRQRQRLQQRHQVHRAALQRRALGERDPIDHQVALAVQTILHGLAKRQEAGAQLVGHGPQTKVEAGGLELIVTEGDRGRDPAIRHRRPELVIGQHAGAGHAIGRRGCVGHPAHLAPPARGRQDEGRRPIQKHPAPHALNAMAARKAPR